MLNIILNLDKIREIQKVGNPRRKLENNIMNLLYPDLLALLHLYFISHYYIFASEFVEVFKKLIELSPQ